MPVLLEIFVAWLAATGLVAVLWVIYGFYLRTRGGLRVVTLLRAEHGAVPAHVARLALWMQDVLFGAGRVVLIEEEPQDSYAVTAGDKRVEARTAEGLSGII